MTARTADGNLNLNGRTSAFGALEAPATTLSFYLYCFLRRIEKLYMFLYNESGIGPIFPAHSETGCKRLAWAIRIKKRPASKSTTQEV